MSVVFNKFDCFVQDMGRKAHDLNADTLMILLTNTAPVAGDTVVDTTGGVCVVKGVSNGNEVAAASGYVKNGAQVAANAYTQASGLAKLVGTKIVWTAGAAIGPFQYAVLYNLTAGAAATRPVIGWWNYGSSISLAIGETFTIGNSNDGTNWTTTYPILSNQ